MFIDLKTKKIIIPKGKRIKVTVKEGRKEFPIKIDDSVLIKYSPNKLKSKFNILPAQNVGKKDNRFYNNNIEDYKINNNIVKIIYKPIPSMTIKELKEIKIKKVGDFYYSLNVNKNNEDNKNIFLGNESKPSPDYRKLYLKKKKEIESIKSYDKLVELNLYEES